MESPKTFYWHIRKDTCLTNKYIDATISFYKWEIYRIMDKFLSIEDINENYKKLVKIEWVYLARYSRDVSNPNKYIIEEILE